MDLRRSISPCTSCLRTVVGAALLTVLLLAPTRASAQQDQQPIPLSIDAGVNGQKIRIAAANFKGGSGAGGLRATFDKVLFNDLTNAGIFDLVSKSMIPQAAPGAQNEIRLNDWTAQPANAAYVAFGSFTAQGSQLVVNGILDDANNSANPQIFSRQYAGEASEEQARQIAHKFADEIILRLGGGVNGIAETKLYYIHLAGGSKEVWEMDYDGADQHAITHLGTITLSPRVSPDNSRLAFSSLGKNGFQVGMYSLLLGRLVAFPVAPGTNLSPAWSPDGKQIAYSSSRTGDPEIWVSDLNGSLARRITSFAGPDVSPVFNPRTGSQIAWISGRTGLPQLYVMEADGSSVQRLTDGGYVSSPSWSPNGQFVAFGWNRKYGPGAPGGQDIYVMEIATKRWIQLTNGIGPCDFPSWSPDGRHLVFANSPDGRIEHTRIMSMLVDGAQKQTLTGTGSDMPNWSFR